MDDLKKLIREVPDYPKPGILFYDLTTLLKDKQGFHSMIDRLCAHYDGHTIDVSPVSRRAVLSLRQLWPTVSAQASFLFANRRNYPPKRPAFRIRSNMERTRWRFTKTPSIPGRALSFATIFSLLAGLPRLQPSSSKSLVAKSKARPLLSSLRSFKGAANSMALTYFR